MKKYFDKLVNKKPDEFYKSLKKSLKNNQKSFIVTANPETFMIGLKDDSFNKLLLSDETILIPDGIGIVKAARMLKYKVENRIPGIDVAIKLLEFCDEMHKKIYLYGSKQEVIDKMKKVLEKTYPNIILCGSKNGYSKDKNKDFENISKLKPDVVLVALGIPIQEQLIYDHLKDFDKGIFIGVGGSFDVISGSKKRAPKVFQKLNLEWFYRLIKEPKRIKRFYNSNIKFLFKIVQPKIIKLINFSFLLIILLVIFGGFVKPIVKPHSIQYNENRPSNLIPSFSLKDFKNGLFQSKIELAYADQIPLSAHMKKNYYLLNGSIENKFNNLVLKDYCKNNYMIVSGTSLKFGCDNNLVYNTRYINNEKVFFDNNIENINTYIKKYPNLEFFTYYIEKDTDIDFKTNIKAGNYEYIKSQLNLDENHISRLEINDFKTFQNYFYKADHHWDYKGSYKGYTDVMKLLKPNDKLLKPIEEKCFGLTFSGSKGAATGATNIYKDDFCAYQFDFPKHEEYINNVLSSYGKYQDYFNGLKNNASHGDYGEFYGGDEKLLEFYYNNNSKENLLIFGESYDNAINTLISTHFNHTYNVDLRNYKDTPFAFDKFIIEHDIDKVLLIGNIDFFELDIFLLEG